MGFVVDKKRHCNGVYPSTSFFPCQRRSTNAYYLYFIHLLFTLYNPAPEGFVKSVKHFTIDGNSLHSQKCVVQPERVPRNLEQKYAFFVHV
jgi:hypothetical protein